MSAPFETSLLEFTTGMPIFHEGDPADAAFLITEGEVEVSKRTHGHRVQVARLTVGDVLGEMALLSDIPRSADAIAAVHTKAIRVSRNEFDKRVAAMDPVMRRIFRILTRRLREATDQIAAHQDELGHGPAGLPAAR